MQTEKNFSAKHWIAANVITAERIEPDALDAVESFTLLWKLFEGLVCDNSATLSRLEKLGAEIVERRRCRKTLEHLFTRFQSRYCKEGAFTAPYEALRVRASDRRDFIESVLRGDTTDYTARITALLYLLSRLQASLLHGPASLAALNSAAPALQDACQLLATLIEAHGRYFKRQRYTGAPVAVA